MFTITPKKNLPEDFRKKVKIAIAFSSWHTDIVNLLVQGAVRACREKGLMEEQIEFFSAPGAYELPQLVEKIARSKKFHAIAPMGCVVRGETNHYELISNTIAKAFDEIGRTHQVAVSFGVITADNLSQAMSRAEGAKGNKGSEAAHAALELAAELEKPETYEKPGRAVAINRELSAATEDLARATASWEQAAARMIELKPTSQPDLTAS